MAFVTVFIAAILGCFVLLIVFHCYTPYKNHLESVFLSVNTLFLYAFERQMQLHVALLGFTKRTNLPRLRAYVCVTALAANPKHGFFALVKGAVPHRVV
jgi:hypothetical protein